MGADFIFATCRRLEDRDAAIGLVDQLSDERLDRVVDQLSDERLDRVWGLQTGDAPENDEDRKDEDRKAVRLFLKEAVDVACSDRRDLGWFQDSDDQYWLITGGMSWGDDPTDAYQYIMAIAESGIDVMAARRRGT